MKMPKSRKRAEYYRKWLQHGWIQLKLNQDHFHPTIRKGGRAPKTTSFVSRYWGQHNWKCITTVEAQLIPGGSASKIAMEGASVSPAPPTISGGGCSTMENSFSTIGAQLEQNWTILSRPSILEGGWGHIFSWFSKFNIFRSHNAVPKKMSFSHSMLQYD